VNASVPKEIKPEDLQMDKAIALLAERAAQPRKSKRRAAGR